MKLLVLLLMSFCLQTASAYPGGPIDCTDPRDKAENLADAPWVWYLFCGPKSKVCLNSEAGCDMSLKVNDAKVNSPLKEIEEREKNCTEGECADTNTAPVNEVDLG